ncbi:MAG: helix-turn-helix domain-containing protein [Verrucomicrobiaceae bacterium]
MRTHVQNFNENIDSSAVRNNGSKETQDFLSARPFKLALSRTEAADVLGVSPATIDRLTKRSLLRPSRATRRPLYAVSEIERFLRETTTALDEPGLA